MIVATFACLVGSLATAGEPPKARDEYVAKLTAAAATADAQFRLANWARRQGMPDVADGHLQTAVHLDPQFASAQKAFGRTLRDGVWETKEERNARLERETRLRTERVEWRKRIAEEGVEKAVAGRRLDEAAAAEIEAFALSDRARATAALEVFKNSKLGVATGALVRMTLLSPFEDVRGLAAEALKQRNADHYVPTLLEALRPIRTGKSVVAGVGEVWHWQDGAVVFAIVPAQGDARLDSGAAESAALEEKMAEREAVVGFRRGNAAKALEIATNLKLGADHTAWLKALPQISDTFIDDRPPQARAFESTYYQPDSMSIGVWRAPQASCFAAGTPVVAKRGEVPIDKVCLGELVLSRNSETGETAYKPVLGRTLRPRVAMKKLTIGTETFLATAGHPFWTNDKGWTTVKNLAQGAKLGAEDGSASLTKIAQAEEPAQAYNLVVADFGTYFVGKSRVLVHDNTPIRESK